MPLRRRNSRRKTPSSSTPRRWTLPASPTPSTANRRAGTAPALRRAHGLKLSPVKIATWNVNGIRARQAQMQEFLDTEQPDVLCLQELKASIDQLPAWLCDIEGYWCY